MEDPHVTSNERQSTSRCTTLPEQCHLICWQQECKDAQLLSFVLESSVKPTTYRGRASHL